MGKSCIFLVISSLVLSAAAIFHPRFIYTGIFFRIQKNITFNCFICIGYPLASFHPGYSNRICLLLLAFSWVQQLEERELRRGGPSLPIQTHTHIHTHTLSFAHKGATRTCLISYCVPGWQVAWPCLRSLSLLFVLLLSDGYVIWNVNNPQKP